MIIKKGRYEYHVVVGYDENPDSPRKWSPVGIMVCAHHKYHLGDEQIKYNDCNSWDEAMVRYFNEKDNVVNEDILNMSDKQINKIQKYIKENYIVKPLYLYDHSGFTINTTGFYCKWDSDLVGFIYTKKGTEGLTDEELQKVLDGEVKIYDDYLRGNIYKVTLQKNEIIHCAQCNHTKIKKIQDESCSGFIGDNYIDNVKEFVKDCFPELTDKDLESLEVRL